MNVHQNYLILRILKLSQSGNKWKPMEIRKYKVTFYDAFYHLFDSQ